MDHAIQIYRAHHWLYKATNASATDVFSFTGERGDSLFVFPDDNKKKKEKEK